MRGTAVGSCNPEHLQRHGLSAAIPAFSCPGRHRNVTTHYRAVLFINEERGIDNVSKQD